jgi:hypothetical protein
MSERSGEQTVILTTIWWWQTVRERLRVSKQTMHRVHTEKFNLKKLNEVEDKEQYRVEISNSFELWKTWTLRWMLIGLGKPFERI